MRIKVTPEMRVHRMLKKCPSFSMPPKSIPLAIAAPIEVVPELRQLDILGWFDKRSLRQGDGYYIVVTNAAVIDIEPDKFQVVRYDELVNVESPHQKQDISKFILETTSKSGVSTRIAIPHVDQHGAQIFTVLRFLQNVISDQKHNPA